MDITYCNNECAIGKATRENFLEINNSALDAVIDFWAFTENCFKNCPYKDKHTKENN